MANFDLSWTVSAGTYAQELYLKQKYASGQYNLVGSFDGTVNSYNLDGLVDDKIYQYKLKSFCYDGIPKETAPAELIGFTCPQVSALPVCNGVINYSFAHIGGDVDEYDVVLYNSTGNTELVRQTKAVANTVTGSFTALAPSTTYKIRVVPKADTFSEDGCNLVTVITLPAVPSLVSSPSSVARCDDGPNSITTLTASFSGSSLTYSWYRNGVLIANGGNYSGATTTSLTIQNAGSILGSFVCRATNGCGFVESNAAVITLLADTSISTQPSTIPTCVTDPITLSVTAGGESLTYQWQRSTDGGSSYSNILGATGSTYTLAGGTAIDGDRYRVVVNSTCGPEINSTPAIVDTVVTPVIDVQPTNQMKCSTAQGTLTVAYTAEDTTEAIWQENVLGNWYDIAGATSTTYLTPTYSPLTSGYRFKVSNACGTVYSNTVTVNNYFNLYFSTETYGTMVCVGQDATLTNVWAGDNGSPQWAISTDGGATFTDIPGATSNSITIPNVQYSQNNHQYRFTVTGPCNTISVTAVLNVYEPVVITAQPQTQTSCVGGPAVYFSVSFTGTASIQWQRSTNGGATWSNMSGFIYPTFGVNNSSTTQNGYRYRAVLTGTCGTVISNEAVNIVNTPPVISTNPQSGTVCEGGNFTFLVTATGTISSYQWQLSTNGGSTWNNISLATSSSYTVTAATLAQSGYRYRVIVTGPCGTATSSAAILTVTSSAATWVNRDINTYYVCVGTDKYYQQIDTNGCSPTYNQTQTGSLYEANSLSCGYVPCNPPTVTSASMGYLEPCSCPSGYVSSPDLSECVQEVTVSATAPTASTFDRTLVAKTYFNYGVGWTAIYTGGFNPATGVPTGTVITDTSTWWKNTDSVSGPMNRCAVWTNLETSNQRIGFSICLNTTQDKTYLVGVGSDNFASIKLNGTTILTQDPSALGAYWVGSAGNLTTTFTLWHVYPIFIPAGNNVIEVSGNNVSDVAAVGVEIYDGTPAQILAAQSYTALGQRLVFSTKDIVGTQVLSGTDGVGYTCPDSSYVIKSCGLATPVCYKVLTTTCGST